MTKIRKGSTVYVIAELDDSFESKIIMGKVTDLSLEEIHSVWLPCVRIQLLQKVPKGYKLDGDFDANTNKLITQAESLPYNTPLSFPEHTPPIGEMCLCLNKNGCIVMDYWINDDKWKYNENSSIKQFMIVRFKDQ